MSELAENYSQSVDVSVPSRVKSMQWIGIFAVLISLGFLMLAIFLSPYFVIAIVLFLAIGILNIRFYNTQPKEFTYEITPARLTIAKKDLVGRQKRVLQLMLADISSFELMEGLAVDEDFVFYDTGKSEGVYQIIFENEGKSLRLLFAPDDYMTLLIRENLKNFAAQKAEMRAENESLGNYAVDDKSEKSTDDEICEMNGVEEKNEKTAEQDCGGGRING